MSLQSRETGLLGEYIRLYHYFDQDGLLWDPVQAPVVFIVGSNYNAESSSSNSTGSWLISSQTSSSSSSIQAAQQTMGFGPLIARREAQGVWYIDWYVDPSLSIGQWYDRWVFKWTSQGTTCESITEFQVHASNTDIFWTSPTTSTNISSGVVAMLNDLENDFLHEAQHIPIYWEHGLSLGDNRTFKFSYQNWRNDFRPMVRVNKRLKNDGWTLDWNGILRFDKKLTPEDAVNTTYHFRYFSNEEMLDFLVAGMEALNAVPPVSEYYTNLANIPFYWKYGIILYAALTGMQRLIYGLNFQEKQLIMGDDWTIVNGKIQNISKMYADYNTTWQEFAKNIKSRRLPGIGINIQPEYTLPGGRSRWFRYLYKG